MLSKKRQIDELEKEVVELRSILGDKIQQRDSYIQKLQGSGRFAQATEFIAHFGGTTINKKERK